MPPVGEVDAIRGEKLRTGNSVDLRFQPFLLILGNDPANPIRQRRSVVAAQQMVEGIDRKLVVVFRDQHLIAALLEIIDCGARCRLQGGDSLRFLVIPFPACPCLIFKHHEEPARGSFPCTDPVNERQVVLLQQATVFIGFLRHLLLHDLSVPVQVGTLGNDLDLHFDRADFQKRNK